jgi:hypothetical protein
MVLTLGATVAQADNGVFYAGASVVRNSVTDFTATAGGLPDLKNTSWKAFAGVRPVNWLAAEAEYIDLGSASSTTGTGSNVINAEMRGSAFAAYAVGFLPIPLPVVDIFGKAGFSSWRLDGNYAAEFMPLSSEFADNGTAFAWGIGVQAHIGMFGARLEYESFNIPNSSGAKIASLSGFLSLR